MGEICCTPSPQHQHNNWFHCRLNVWEAEPFSNRQQRWQLSRKRARAFTTYLLSTHAGHKDPSSVTPVNLVNRDSTKHALTLSARWKTPPPPLFFYRQHRARLLWNHVKSQHNFYVIVDHGGNTPFTIPWYGLTQWPTESKSDPAGILQQGRTQLTRLRVNHPCVAVAAIQAGQEGSGAQCQTSWHPHRHTIGCDRRELTTRDCEWREWRRRPAGLIWAGKICFLSPRRVSRTTELRSQLNTV